MTSPGVKMVAAAQPGSIPPSYSSSWLVFQLGAMAPALIGFSTASSGLSWIFCLEKGRQLKVRRQESVRDNGNPI